MSYERFVRQAKELRLYTAPGGNIWHGDGTSAAVSSSSSAEFLREAIGDNCERIRILGTHQNASLISSLYLWRESVETPCLVEVGSPYRIGVSYEQERPEVVLSQMAGNMLSPAVGGWHPLALSDHTIYSLVAELYQQGRQQTFTDKLNGLLLAHPAWPALSFICGMDKNIVACLLAEIVDPRWHTNPDEGEITRLHTYLGVGRKSAMAHIDTLMKKATSGVEGLQFLEPALRNKEGHDRIRCRCRFGKGSFLDRAELTLLSWSHAPLRLQNAASEGKNPASFLLEGPVTTWKLVKGCRRFLDFVRGVWLGNVYSSHQDRMFAPDHFFKKDPGTLEAWRKHITRCDNKVDD